MVIIAAWEVGAGVVAVPGDFELAGAGFDVVVEECGLLLEFAFDVPPQPERLSSAAVANAAVRYVVVFMVVSP